MRPDASSKDTAFAVMAMDLLGSLLSRADSPSDLGAYLTEEVRELTGARCVVLVECQSTGTLTAHRVVAVNPPRRREWAESPAGNRLYEAVRRLPSTQLWRGDEPSEAPGLLRQEGFELSMALPLAAGDVRVGAMLVLGLPDEEHVTSVLSLLTNLSGIVALVLRSGTLFEKQEQLVRERTAELQRANEELQKDEQRIEALLDGSEQSRRALLSLLEDETRAEEELRRANRALRMLSDTNEALIRVTDETQLLNEVCRIAVEVGGYRMTWVGVAQEDEERTVLPIARAGIDLGYIESAHVRWADSERGRGPSGTAIRTGQPSIARNISVDPAFAPWREAAIERGYNSLIALPLLGEGRALGVLGIYAAETDAFDSKEVEILKELAGDLSFGLTALRTRARRDQAEEALRGSEERFRRLAEHAPDIIYRMSLPDGKYEYVSPAALTVLGHAPEDFYAAPVLFRELLRPEWRDYFEQQWASLLKGEVPPTYEYAVTHPSGGVRWLNQRNILVRDDAGRPIAIEGIVTDITERKRAEDERSFHLTFMEGLDRVNRAIQGTNDLDQMMSDALGAVLSVFDCDRAWLFYPCDPDAPSFRVPMERTRPEFPGAKALDVDLPMPPDMAENLREVLQSADPVAYGVGTARPINKVSAEQFGVRSMIMAALYPKAGKPWAFGLHQCRSARAWTREETDLLREIGCRLSDGLGSLLSLRDLRASEAKYRRIVDTATEGIWVLGPDGLATFVNTRMATLLGCSCEEMIGRPLTAFMFEEDVPDHLRMMEDRRRGLSENYERRFRRKDGETVWTHVSAAPVTDDEHRFKGSFAMFTDITERKRLEEEMRRSAAAIEQAAETIVITDPAGVIEYVNPAFSRVTGYTREEAVGKNPRILQSGKHDQEFYREMWATLLRGETWRGHIVNKRKDGTLFEEDVTISPVRAEGGDVVHYVGVKRDVTQEVALEEQLRQSQKMEAIGRLAGGVAHDFNNLLQAMFSHTQLLQIDPERADTELAELEAQIRRGAALTRQLLLLSRRQEAQREQLDLNEVVSSVGRLLRRLVRENVALAIELGKGAAMVEADRGQLEQVLMNLTINASDAMPGGGRLSIRTGCESELAFFAVEDTGCGIPEAIRAKVFEPLFTTKPVGHGTGLGLSVVEGIVSQHGGRIDLTSTEGVGTTVRVLLPRVKLDETPRATLPAAGDAFPAGRGERVLVVEDEAGARVGLLAVLKSLGYQVAVVGSGGEAQALPGEPAFDVLVSDVMLPDADGTELARGLLGRWPKMRVIFMSGYSEEDMRARAADLGEVQFLQKPFDMGALAKRLRQVLSDEPVPDATHG